MLAFDFVTESEAHAADAQFATLTGVANLDRTLHANPAMAARFARVLGRAIPCAYRNEAGLESAHRFAQRALYRVNDLRHYSNERSPYLMAVRERIERAWQDWEARQLDIPALRRLEAPLALRARVRAGVDPRPSLAGRYFTDTMTVEGYRRLVQILALDGLVEASQLDALGLSSEPEAYLDVVPWEVLASINQSFLLSDRKQHVLRYVGGLLYVEAATPAAAKHYRVAAERLGFPERARGYWEDERHGRFLLEGVALPLAARYPADAWEIVLGYDQQKLLSERATAAIVRASRDADQAAQLRAAA